MQIQLVGVPASGKTTLGNDLIKLYFQKEYRTNDKASLIVKENNNEIVAVIDFTNKEICTYNL